MKKHAYLIIAHEEMQMLEKLLTAIDDTRNDIYVHIDKKTQRFDEQILKSCVSKSNLFFVPRMNVRWGHISQIKCEFRLLECSAKNAHYHYYHLLSGVDYPLKSQDEIHAFLENEEREFLDCYQNGENEDEFLYKVQYYYPLMRWVGRGIFKGEGKKDKFFIWLGNKQWELLEWQKRKGVDRTKNYSDMIFYKGSQWFSVTDAFVRYMLGHKRDVLRMFWLTNAPDELFMQTFAMNSRFKDKVAGNILRRIDWKRGRPYEFMDSDFRELTEGKEFFVRKISFNHSPDLVDHLEHFLNGDVQEEQAGNPLISVIVPIYNVEEYLEECLDSLVQQTYLNLEILLVNDGSSDGSGSIAKEFAGKYSTFVYYEQQNAGLSAARNRGIQNAKGEYLAFVDSDDWVEPDYIERMYQAIHKRDADVAVCGYFIEDGTGEKRTTCFEKEQSLSREMAMKCLSNIFWKENLLMVVAWNKLYKKDVFQELRYPVGKFHEDEFVAHRVIDGAEKVITVAKPLYHYRMRADSITGTDRQQDVRHLDILDAQRDRVDCCSKCMYNAIFTNIVYSFFETVTEVIIRYEVATFQKQAIRKRIRHKAVGIYWKYGKVLPRKYRRECLWMLAAPLRYRKYVLAIRERKEKEDGQK